MYRITLVQETTIERAEIERRDRIIAELSQQLSLFDGAGRDLRTKYKDALSSLRWSENGLRQYESDRTELVADYEKKCHALEAAEVYTTLAYPLQARPLLALC